MVQVVKPVHPIQPFIFRKSRTAHRLPVTSSRRPVKKSYSSSIKTFNPSDQMMIRDPIDITFLYSFFSYKRPLVHADRFAPIYE
ncbi:hypothetical protein DERF_003021 [Dermatophagoides farinae]|uniref:Uncharacterized protein n=1 Tax=Dermatophagoides farinae TaxID=6954 RepID=A0A922IBS0_DERFA|nr:hypothetical protein DERF_003021 [Dermatophagoides farinae]